MDIVLAEVSNQDIEGGIEAVFDFIAMLWGGLMTFLNVLPPIVIGAIVFIAFCFWLIRKAKHG
jgi:hypothetical protein